MATSYSTTTSLIRLASLSAKTITSRSSSFSAYRRYTLISLRTTASNSILPPQAAAPASPPPHFSNLPLDRAAHLRKNSSALKQLLDDSRARTIAFYDRKALVASLPSNKTLNQIARDGGSDDKTSSSATHAALSSTFTLSFDGPESEAPDGGPPAWIPLTWHPRNSDLVESVDQNIGFIFLGLSNDSGAPVFACRLSKLTPKVEKLLENQEDQGEVALVDVRSQGQKMTGNDAAVYALASGLFSWHANNDFCSKTGTSTNPDSAGHARRPQLEISKTSTAAGADANKKPRLPRAVYPRIDPAVIVAVTYYDWLLLGRKKTWDIGRYSLLAGFSEVGETLEDAVLREVVEESGVVLDKSTVQYHSSQPWPFPQSLMIGFLGEAYHTIEGGAPLEEEKKTGSSGGGISSTTTDISTTSGIQTSNTTNNRVSGFDVFPRGSPARNAAMDVGLKSDEIDAYATPAVLVDENEIEDARWFHREWLMEKLNLTSSASSVTTIDQTSSSLSESNNNSASSSSRSSIFISGSNQPIEFRIPGKYALANRLITEWLLGVAHPLLKKSQDGGTKDSPSPSSWSGYSLPDVQIDQGVFKYILLRASNPAGTHSKLLVRGDCRAAYHNHILTACIKEAAAIDPQISITVLGGGRMEHYSPSVTAQSTENEGGGDGTSSGDGGNGSGVARIYGYSAAFGPAPHEITASVLKKADPFLDISHSYEGY